MYIRDFIQLLACKSQQNKPEVHTLLLVHALLSSSMIFIRGIVQLDIVHHLSRVICCFLGQVKLIYAMLVYNYIPQGLAFDMAVPGRQACWKLQGPSLCCTCTNYSRKNMYAGSGWNSPIYCVQVPRCRTSRTTEICASPSSTTVDMRDLLSLVHASSQRPEEEARSMALIPIVMYLLQ